MLFWRREKYNGVFKQIFQKCIFFHNMQHIIYFCNDIYLDLPTHIRGMRNVRKQIYN